MIRVVSCSGLKKHQDSSAHLAGHYFEVGISDGEFGKVHLRNLRETECQQDLATDCLCVRRGKRPGQGAGHDRSFAVERETPRRYLAEDRFAGLDEELGDEGHSKPQWLSLCLQPCHMDVSLPHKCLDALSTPRPGPFGQVTVSRHPK